MIASHDEKLTAERAIIGAMLIDEHCIGKTVSVLTPDDFSEEHKLIFQVISSQFKQNLPVDPITVKNLVGKDNGYIMALMEATPTAQNVDAYAEVLAQQNALLQLKEATEQFTQVPDSETVSDIISAGERVRMGLNRVEVHDSQSRIFSFMDRVGKEETSYMLLGIPKLDANVRANKGDYIVIGAEPSAGKTALAIQFGDTLARLHSVGFYSLETSADKITDRQVAMRCGIEFEKIKMHQLSDEDWIKVSNQFTTMGNFDVIEAAGWKVDQIVAHTVAQNYDVIFIDYLQLIAGDARDSEYQNVTRISKELQRLAHKHNVLVIALSQLKRPDSKSAPTMHDLRSSGQVEQDADAILLLYTDESDAPETGFLTPEDTRRLRVAKNKEGQRGEIPLIFQRKIQRFIFNNACPGMKRRR